MPNITCILPDMVDITGLYLFLRKLSDGAMIGSGFELIDSNDSGFFVADVNQSLAGTGKLLALVSVNNDYKKAFRSFYLHEEMTLCVDQYAISDATAAGQTQIIQAIDNLIPSVGTGEDQVTLTVRQGATPLADASVWITTDVGGQVIIAGTRVTNDLGKVLFMLTHGATYYLWVTKNGVKSIQGQKFIAERDV